MKQIRFIALIIVITLIALLIRFCLIKQIPTVSIIMSVYNRESFVAESIQRALNQKFTNFELIIVDDGSTDNTQTIIRDYAQKDNRIRLTILPQNTGISNARNVGLKQAIGKYITILDSDDLAHDNWLETSVRFMEENPDVIIGMPHATFYIDNGNGWQENTSTYQFISPPYRLLYQSTANVGTFYRHDFIKKNNIRYNKDFISAEDYDFIMQIILKNGPIRRVLTPDAQIIYRIHASHPRQFYQTGYTNEHIIRNTLYEQLGFPKQGNEIPQKTLCELTKTFLEKYPTVFDTITQHIALYHHCNIHLPQTVLFQHPYWQESVAIFPETKQACIYEKRLECASITEQTESYISLYWDTYKTHERFRLENNKYIFEKELPSQEIK